MAQTPATRVQADGEVIDYTPAAAVTAGDVVVLGGIPCVADRDIAISTLGSVSVEGVYRVPKDASVFVAGSVVYWNPAGTPVTGTALSGAATLGQGVLGQPTTYLMGTAVAAAATGASYVDVLLNASKRAHTSLTVAALGTNQATAAPISTGVTLVTAADATVGVLLPSAYAGAQCIIKNGANAVLKVWPYTDDAINAIAANSNYVLAAYTSVILIAYDATTWYSIPLVAS